MQSKHVLSALLAASLVSTAISFAAFATSRASVKVPVDPTTGTTLEQSNVSKRLQQYARTGAILHLYVLSPTTGQPIIYSTVKGKVTSSGKKLSPVSTIKKYEIGSGDNKTTVYEGQKVIIQNGEYITTEVLADDGTYGSSVPYLYWFDTNGRYHQHFFNDGQVIQVSSQPLPLRTVVLDLSK